MATTNSGHHHHRHLDQYPSDGEDSDIFDSWNTNNTDEDHDPINPQKLISTTKVTSRKLPSKPHQRQQRTIPKSLPVNIPDWSKILRESGDHRMRSDGDRVVDDDDDNDNCGDDWLPPHEYLARIRSASLSVHEGVGRTLKGRDLSSLRNAIWKQTGFELD